MYCTWWQQSQGFLRRWPTTTYRWPSSWRFAALRGFIQPVVDAACHARLHHSCFLFGQGQRSAKPGCHQQRGPSRKWQWIGLFPLSLSAPVTQAHPISFLTSSITSSFTLNVLAPPPGELNTLPFSHMLLMFRMLSVTMGRSTAPERGDRDSLFSLCWDKVVGLNCRIAGDVCYEQLKHDTGRVRSD